ncbi:MAG: hypothetical protein MUO91_01370, partial [candidate division Zixibacteria bacterium]|nr:hypothetical protein [candidate division Zixibacteria bacterium]
IIFTLRYHKFLFPSQFIFKTTVIYKGFVFFYESRVAHMDSQAMKAWLRDFGKEQNSKRELYI